MRIISNAARQLTGADGVTFVLRDGANCYYAEEDAISPLWKGNRFPLNTCISGWVMLNRQNAEIEDIYQDPRIPHDAYRPTFVKSLAMVPVRRDDPVAAIGAYWSTHHKPSRDEVEVMQCLADAASLALVNVKLNADLTTNETIMRLFIEHAPAALAMFDNEMRYLAVSRRWMTDYNLGPGEIIGQCHYDIFPEIDERWKEVHRKALNGESVSCDDDHLVRADGSTQWLRWTVRPWYNADGKIGGIVIFTEDTTKRRLAEEAIMESQQRLELALAGADLGTWDWDIRTGKVIFSKRWLEMQGYTEGELPGHYKTWEDLLHPDDKERVLEVLDRHFKQSTPYSVEYRMREKSGGWRWILARGKTFDRDANGSPLRMVGTNLDITERKAMEDERDTAIKFLHLVNTCRDLKELIHSVLDFFQDLSGCEAVGIRLKQGHDYPYYETRGFSKEFVRLENSLCRHDEKGDPILDNNCNPVLDCMCGNVICGRTDPSKSFFTEKGSFWSNRTTQLLATTTDEDRQTHTRNRCNGEGYESVALVPIRSGSERMGLLQLNDKQCGRFTREVVLQWERLAEYLAVALSKFMAEDALKKNEQRMELALHGADLGTWDWNIATGEIKFNRRWAEMLGYTEDEIDPHFNSWEKLLHPDDILEVERTLTAHLNGETDVYSSEHRLRHKNGGWVWVLDKGRVVEWDSDGKPVRACGTHLDITQRHDLETRIRHMEKMNAIGQLAGGIAHDFNNQLSGVLGYSEMLCAKLEDEKLKKYATSIRVTANRAAGLTKQLLAFSRKGKNLDIPINIHDIITEVSGILERSIDKRIKVELALRSSPAITMGDPNQIQNVFLNIGINARDSMPDGGEITFETQNIIMDESPVNGYANDIAPGEYIKISITDTGVGIPKDIQNRIFEPFFTTKSEGKGTGMGLAGAFGIVKSHNGMINVYSEVGHGTSFHIYLPLSHNSQRESVHDHDSPSQGNATVMVVDDEDVIREMMADMLQDLGYKVISCQNGKEALEHYRSSWQEIDLILLDMIMPELSGSDTFAAMKEINPGLKVIIISGYSLNKEAQSVIDNGAKEFLGKPFNQAALAKIISGVLNPG
ncbi:MAG: PAS domain-containing protein [Planctomycetes bacterium]|nr:PAS domain-containing protein [Planctomycetota bacterium]